MSKFLVVLVACALFSSVAMAQDGGGGGQVGGGFGVNAGGGAGAGGDAGGQAGAQGGFEFNAGAGGQGFGW